ncbi:MAG: hypothetical protein H0W43_11640 [Chthoniobacterales bacterium]|nr:hypothetical protein [Chthoniobacterales bacterium]
MGVGHHALEKTSPVYRHRFLACSIAHAGPFARWAARGVVVNKTFRPTPLSHSLGLDGIYRLEVRGPDEKVRRQMVTKEVFLAYEIGDEFDEQTGHVAVKGKSVPVEASVQVAATPQSPSLADVLEAKDESKDRLASANFPREMLPEDGRVLGLRSNFGQRRPDIPAVLDEAFARSCIIAAG